MFCVFITFDRILDKGDATLLFIFVQGDKGDATLLFIFVSHSRPTLGAVFQQTPSLFPQLLDEAL
jgi:hypothetical protein